MAEPREYKLTLFDRHGPVALDYLRAWAFGLLVFGLVVGVLATQRALTVRTLLGALAAGAAAGGGGFLLGHLVGTGWKAVAVDGGSTPYQEQYSYQQALVMRGQIDEALRSYEAVIAEQPDAVDAHIRAAELYIEERGDFERAAGHFRAVQRTLAVAPGHDIYATNRLVDLLTGPLNEPGRAMVELRHLIERYPASSGADHARRALAELKARRV